MVLWNILIIYSGCKNMKKEIEKKIKTSQCVEFNSTKKDVLTAFVAITSELLYHLSAQKKGVKYRFYFDIRKVVLK